jgi:hypothetical protein
MHPVFAGCTGYFSLPSTTLLPTCISTGESSYQEDETLRRSYVRSLQSVLLVELRAPPKHPVFFPSSCAVLPHSFMLSTLSIAPVCKMVTSYLVFAPVSSHHQPARRQSVTTRRVNVSNNARPSKAIPGSFWSFCSPPP